MPPRPNSKNEDKMLIWFFGSFIAGLIPFIARYLVHLNCEKYEVFDIKDAVFLGLAMNLSNLNMLSEKTMRRKVLLTFCSALVLVALAFMLGLFQLSECLNKDFKAPDGARNIVFGLTAFSTLLSCVANLASAKYIKLS
jgi:hypothetical protein